MKLWLLDADLVIDLFALGKFDLLAKQHQIHVASTVIDEIKFYVKGDVKYPIEFRKNYVNTGRVTELSASHEDVIAVYNKIPNSLSIHDGEIESLAILVVNEELTFCTCDCAAIRALPFLDCSDRGISVEKLLKASGVTVKDLQARHTQAYFDSNLGIGTTLMICRT